MSKNIVLCCEGTGNGFDGTTSNVTGLFKVLIIDGRRQIAYYHTGIGTEESPLSRTRYEAALSKVIGKAFGSGIIRYVVDAYCYLMKVYEDGDKVFLFGFSRGAYTVRALEALIQTFGLLLPGLEGMALSVARQFARLTRKAAGMTKTFAAASAFKATFSRPCSIHFVGLWDAVGSVGFFRDSMKLPYTGRSPNMVNGRHALSIDERRCYFQNISWGSAFPGQNIKEVWFAGVHSDVGGSYPRGEDGLSQITLEWMLSEAVTCGLLVEQTRVSQEVGPEESGLDGRLRPNPAQKIHVSLNGLWWILELLPNRIFDVAANRVRWLVPFGAPRRIPLGAVIHESVAKKIEIDPCPSSKLRAVVE